MNIYTAGMSYNEEAVYKLAEMQHRTFQAGKRLGMVVTSVVLLFAGFSLGLKTLGGIILVFIGCILITGINARPRSTAKALLSQINGKFPQMEYSFTDTGFKSADEDAETPYSAVLRLIDDGRFFYIYVTSQKAYMVDSSTVEAADSAQDNFKSFVASKTGHNWEKPTNFFNTNIKKLISIRKSSRGNRT